MGRIGPLGSLRRLTDVPGIQGHRTARRAYPEGQFAAMKWVNIKDLWVLARPENLLQELGGAGRRVVADRGLFDGDVMEDAVHRPLYHVAR